MATFRRRPSELREIGKNLCKNDESEMSSSPSPSAWIKQIQEQQSQRSSYQEQDLDYNTTGNKFEFRATNVDHEIIDDHEESEMESDYVSTEVSEEEIRDIQVPYETEIEESESQSDYTSVTDHHSPLYAMSKHRRQSMPNLTKSRMRDDEAENRAPIAPSPPPPQALRSDEQQEEEKDIEDDSDSNHCGSINRSLILSQCVSDEAPKASKKQSILPPKELTFDEVESPAPPSILRTKPSRKKKRQAMVAEDTPHFADIANHLAGIHGDMLHPAEREQEQEEEEIEVEEEEIESSPLMANPKRKDRRESSETHKIILTNNAIDIADSLEQRMKQLKQTLPSPVVQTPVAASAVNKRRSARLAKKKGNVCSNKPQVDEEEEEDASMADNDERPYIDDEILNHDPPLPPSNKSSVSRRTRTLRSRKKEVLQEITSPISDDDDAAAGGGGGGEEEDYPTFGTPKSNKTSKRKRKKSNRSNKSNSKRKKRNKGKTAAHDSPNINENEDEKQEISTVDATDTPFMDMEEDGDELPPQLDEMEEEIEEIAVQRKVRSHKKKDTKTKSKRTKPKKTKKDKKKTAKKDNKKKSKSRKRKVSQTELSSGDSYEPDSKRRRLSEYVNPPVGATQAEETGCRRSKRVRFKPLAYWASERIEYTPTPLTLESFADRLESDIIVGQKNRLDEFVNKRKTKKRPSKRTKKKKKTKKKERQMSVSDEDIDDDDEEQTPFSGNAWIYDPNTDQMSEKCVVKTDKSLNLVPLSFGNDSTTNNNDNNEPVSKRVRGAKGLEEDGFSCGVLEIPPESQKHAEVSYFTEQFFVHQAEKKKLLFKVGDESEFHLSRGSLFFVPPENEYSLHNLSQTVPVKLIFTLIKKEANRTQQDAYETQTQVSTTQGTPL
eukprot:141538_1